MLRLSFNGSGLPNTRTIKKAFNLLSKVEDCGDWGVRCDSVVSSIQTTKRFFDLSNEAIAAALLIPVAQAQAETDTIFQQRHNGLEGQFNKKIRDLVDCVMECDSDNFGNCSDEVQALSLTQCLMDFRKVLDTESVDELGVGGLFGSFDRKFSRIAKQKFPGLFSEVSEHRKQANAHIKKLSR